MSSNSRWNKTRFAAWATIFFLVPIRLYFFIGYGAQTDDVNSVHTTLHFLHRGALDPDLAHHYRILTLLPRAWIFQLLGVSPITHVLSVFFISILAAGIAVMLAQRLFGDSGAFIMAILLACTPFENLVSTMDVPDLINGFFSLATVFALVQAQQQKNHRWLYPAALFAMANILNKVSGTGMLLLSFLFLATTSSKKSQIRTFAGGVALLFLAICGWDYSYSGHFLRWFTFNNFFDGFDVSNNLVSVWSRFPRYLLAKDDYGHWMFGSSGWLAAVGVSIAAVRFVRNPKRSLELLILIFVLGHFLLINFLPHKLTLAGYYSHPRIFRYLATLTPLLYLASVYCVLFIFSHCHGVLSRWVAALGCAVLFMFNVQQSFLTVEPAKDSTREFREMLSYLRAHPPETSTQLSADMWKCPWMHVFLLDLNRDFRINCLPSGSASAYDISATMIHAPSGILVTGGSNMPWYGNMDLLLNTTRPDFIIPTNWKLLYEIPGPPTAWREEPLRIWQVQ